MATEVVLFKSEERKSLSEVAEFVRLFADRLDQHEVTLRQGEDEVTLTIPEQVVLELKVEEEAKRSGTKYSLEIEIEWTEGDTGDTGVALG